MRVGKLLLKLVIRTIASLLLFDRFCRGNISAYQALLALSICAAMSLSAHQASVKDTGVDLSFQKFDSGAFNPDPFHRIILMAFKRWKMPDHIVDKLLLSDYIRLENQKLSTQGPEKAV